MRPYTAARKRKRAFRAMTSLTIDEFNILLKPFSQKWTELTQDFCRNPGNGGRPRALRHMEDRLFFILIGLTQKKLKPYCQPIQSDVASGQPSRK